MTAELRPTRVLYLDLDGTVRKGFDELGRFVNGPADVELYPGMARLLHAYKSEGWRLLAVSNQGGVALGHVTMDACFRALSETQRQTGDAFDGLFICIHHPEAKNPEVARCWCRKPRIGMLIEARLHLQQHFPTEYYPVHLALMVGDRAEDRECAANAGIDFLDAATWRALGRPVSGVQQGEPC